MKTFVSPTTPVRAAARHVKPGGLARVCAQVCVCVCVFRRSSQSKPDHRDGPCLWLTPHSAWVIKLLEAPCHACPLININYRGSCSLADSSPLLSAPLPSFFPPLLSFTHPTGLIIEPSEGEVFEMKTDILYHCASDCDVLSFPHPARSKDLRRFTVCTATRGGPKPTLSLPQGSNSQQAVSCGFPVHFPDSFTYGLLCGLLVAAGVSEKTTSFTETCQRQISFCLVVVLFIFSRFDGGHQIHTVVVFPLPLLLPLPLLPFCLDLLREMVWSGGSDAAADYTEIRRLTSNLPSAVWGSVSQLE